ncbi:organic solute transporter subunit alpha/Transmembrane protein, partial [Polychytrium aggregatum]|uniref:organic solute transporter subunit alpha/Transmembrane protein n=1 Tax=Polychytrium aggregatum TaxID=110093 RepID=UPI0022FE7915
MFDKCVSDVSTNSSVSNFYHPQSSSWNPFLDPNESPYLWIGWIAAGVFAAFATFTSSILIIQHWLNYTRPQFQKAYVRILAMVPMYAVCSWVSFRYYKEAIYLNVMRDCYEGFVVYSFYNLCLQYLGSTPAKQRERLARKSRQRLPPPMCCFYFDPSHKHFLSLCKLGIVQYVVVRVTTTFFAVVLESMGMYCNESMSPMFGHFWTTLANAVAMSLAMFTLITFYLAVRKDISRFHPVWQFLSVKFVIFFGFWQSFVIKVLVSAGWIQNSEHWTIEELSISLQSFMTCVEMAIASIIHLWAFRYEDFIP